MEFIIGNKIEPCTNPTNTYVLTISNMHGDADAETETEAYFDKDQEEAYKEFIELLNWAQKDWPSRDAIKNKFNDLCEKYNQEIFDEDLIDRDATADHEFLCRPSFESLVWYDENGIEYNVTIK